MACLQKLVVTFQCEFSTATYLLKLMPLQSKKQTSNPILSFFALYCLVILTDQAQFRNNLFDKVTNVRLFRAVLLNA